MGMGSEKFDLLWPYGSHDAGEPTIGNTAASINSQWIQIRNWESASIHLAWDGTTQGTLVVAGSNDLTNSEDLGITIGSDPAGSPGSELINLTDINFDFIRIEYTRVGGSGDMTGKVVLKNH